MHLERNRYGEDSVIYESVTERDAAIANYLKGNYAALTCKEIAQFRDCEEDPNNVRWEAAHAGQFAEGVDPLDFNGLTFIYDLGRTFEEGLQMLYAMVGPHPITALTIWQLHQRLGSKVVGR